MPRPSGGSENFQSVDGAHGPEQRQFFCRDQRIVPWALIKDEPVRMDGEIRAQPEGHIAMIAQPLRYFRELAGGRAQHFGKNERPIARDQGAGTAQKFQLETRKNQ